MTTAEWWDIARYVGAGGAFVLGITSHLLWKAFREEVAYTKARDKETLNVLMTLTNVIKEGDSSGSRRSDSMTAGLQELRHAIEKLDGTIQTHILKKQP